VEAKRTREKEGDNKYGNIEKKFFSTKEKQKAPPA
jgi:hypothetical protein